MKKCKFIFLLICLSLLVSCEKEESAQDRESVLTITEKSKASDAPTRVTHTERFYYRSGQLAQYKNEQTYDEQQITAVTSLSYDWNSLITRDESGNQYSYLKDSYHVNMCDFTEPGTNNSRRYFFYYNEEGYLIRLIEKINEKDSRDIRLEYRSGALASIETTYFEGERTFVSTQYYQTGSQPNKDKLPFLPLTEEYPFYFHKVACYAGLMGKPLDYLPQSSRYKDNADEETFYAYENNAQGQITSLTVNTVSYGTSYKRNFQYSYE